MLGHYKSGFTLLEILIAITLLGVMAIVVVPNMVRFSPKYEREKFLTALDGITQFAWQNALSTGMLHRVEFDFGKRRISLSKASQKKDSKGQPIFEPVKETYLGTAFKIPSTIDIKQFIIEGYDELSRYVGRKTQESWFYIMPDGLTQAVTINFTDAKDLLANGKPRSFGLVLNPFTAQFKRYDAFQK